MKGEVPHSNWSIRCISTPGPDTDLSVYVSFDKARFLFGCGSGTQRAFAQKRLRMPGLGAIFLPGGTEDGRGGLAGTIMTAADAGIKELSVVGPPDTSHFLATLRSAVQRDLINIKPISFPTDVPEGEAEKVFSSPNMTVHAIALRSNTQPSTSTSAADKPTETSVPEGSRLPFDPLARSFRPSKLSPQCLRQWTDTVVGDMFGQRSRANEVSSNPPRSHPLMTADGTVRFARADTRYTIPPVSDAEVETEMIYICQAPDVRGKFDVKKADSLGVPKGPSRGMLVKGMEIEVDDDTVPGGKRTIKPEDCLVGGGPGAALILVNCSQHNLDRLLAVDYLKRYQPEITADAAKVHVIVHQVPLSVWQDERYQAWVKAYGPETHHLFADSQNGSQEAFFRNAAWNATQLSLLDPDIFPVPYSGPNPQAPAMLSNCQVLVPNLEVRMHPPGPPAILPPHVKDRPFPTNPSDVEWAREVLSRESTEYALACDEARRNVENDPRSSSSVGSEPGDDIVVTTLGTGSAIPSKYRNVSATHLDIPGLGGILLDCGEGSLGQLRRRFGPEGTRRVMTELKMIYISHMHADHHLGLQAILREKVKLGTDGPFFVVGPISIGMSLSETRAWQHGISQDILDSVIFMDNIRFTPLHKNQISPPASPRLTSREVSTSGWPTVDIFVTGEEATARHEESSKLLKETLGLTSMFAPLVEHRGRAFGLVLEHQSGWKIVYSGDTKPCNELVKVGRDATLLIHEATLEDDKPEVAAQKGHSTFSQAIDVGQRMNASHILLNHFSQRYPKLPKLNLPTHPSIDGERQPDISISFDFMSIKVGDMWKMAHYMDPLSLLFDEAEPEDGDETTGAVEGDVNPTLDVPAKGKGAQNGKGSQNQTGGDAPISKKASKRAERKAAQKLLDEEKEGNNTVRERSPGDTPEAKRTRMDVEAVPVTNTA